MLLHAELKPKLRPVEPVLGTEPGTIGVRDPSGLSPAMLSMTEPAFFILTRFDGQNCLSDVQRDFQQRYGQPLAFETLGQMVTHLEEALLLEGDRFEKHYAALLEAYRAAPARPMRSAAALGIADGAAQLFDEILHEAPPIQADGDVVGVIAPHLDYPRGRPCYGSAYAALSQGVAPKRVVILGTNHFGRGGVGAVVATGQDFETPLGTTATDRAFLERIEARCGDLRRFEYDHLAEHSVELQVCWLQHLFGAAAFKLVAFLCPDPCGPSGTAPRDGQGVDLAEFARVLGEEIAADPAQTVVVAGADFSHVGGYFGDEHPLDDGFLAHVREQDQAALRHIEAGDGAAFRESIAQAQNPTRICSAGCMFSLLTALPDARATVLRYHQAVEPTVQNCVTCAAVVFRR